MKVVLLALLCLVACGGRVEPKAPSGEATNTSAPRVDPEDGPPTDSNAEPLFTAAARICRLVDHKDDNLLAVSFAPGFFDTTPPTKLDAAFFEVRGALGHCGSHMTVIQRASPLEGVVAVECEHGVLLLSIGLDTTPHRPMMTLGLEMRPGSNLREMRGRPGAK
jgi:hypothetical protein